MEIAFSDMIGNEALRASLGKDISQGRFSHAYIIEGAYGFGKHMLASRIAAALSCERSNDASSAIPCMQCPSCRKILSGNSPDLIYVGKGDKATLGVDAIRAMHRDVWIAPNELSYKIYVVEEAHLMTVQAQNAFLLTLEEPPAYVCFLLLCENATLLLETVRSRAPVLRLSPISIASIREALCRTEPTAKNMLTQSPAEFEELLVASNGSIGRAKELLDPKRRRPILEQRENAREWIKLAASHRNSGAVLAFFQSLGQKREELLSTFGVVQLALRDLLLCKQAEHAPLCFFADREEAADLSYKFSAPELLHLCNCIEEAVLRLRANANVRLTLTMLAVNSGLLP